MRTNQALGARLLTVAALLDQWELVAIQSGVFLLATLQPALNPYAILYRFILRPLGLLRSDLRPDHMAAHRFATMVGSILTATASYLLITGHTQIGWSLVWLIVTLTAIALLGWCAGCFTYYTLHRMGLMRFMKHAPTCSIPGARPPKPTNHNTN